ncbi:spore cortex biosynthesis protein YabQ [Brevibacillus sp. GCM10020057]|uniref:spore cortex biosynthesis protein YabQ n=1 Tax=Brevibacillus sp. GCM10020057 TaxID=3317327 RepID=UPI0036427519
MNIGVQLQTVLAMSTCGVLMGMGFDTYHVFKGKSRLPLWMVFIFDILFWVGSMGAVFLILLKVNNGIIRFPIFFGMIFGAWVYFVIGSKKYIQLLHRVIEFCQWLYRTVLQIIDVLVVRPVLFFYRVILMTLAFLYSGLLAILGFLWKVARFVTSPFARWGQQMGKKMFSKSRGIWFNWKNLFHSKRKRE